MSMSARTLFYILASVSLVVGAQEIYFQPLSTLPLLSVYALMMYIGDQTHIMLSMNYQILSPEAES